MQTTNIEWVRSEDGTPGLSWNPVRGCSHVSAGCDNCWAARMASRFGGPDNQTDGYIDAIKGRSRPYRGFAANGHWSGKVALIESELDRPLHWNKPRKIAVGVS